MPSIRKIRKAIKRKYGIKTISYCIKFPKNIKFFPWKSHTNLTHPGKYFRPSKVKIMSPTSPK